jgi:hypothetical protein
LTVYVALYNSTQGDIINNLESSLLQDRNKCDEERRAIRRAKIGLAQTQIVIPQLLRLEAKYSNYVLAQMQGQWNECGLYSLTKINQIEYEVQREGKTRTVKWEDEMDVATCTCLWPSSRAYPCRHVLRLAMELKRGLFLKLTLSPLISNPNPYPRCGFSNRPQVVAGTKLCRR